jgi:hypothetical protein
LIPFGNFIAREKIGRPALPISHCLVEQNRSARQAGVQLPTNNAVIGQLVKNGR